MIHYIRGDATDPQADGTRIIAHIVNDVGAWGKGFVMALSKRYPHAKTAYKKWTDRKLGEVQFVGPPKEGTVIASMCAQKGIGRGRRRVQYGRLKRCLRAVREMVEAFKKIDHIMDNGGVTVHMPKIGTGLGGGDWKIIERIIKKELKGVDVYLYELPEKK